MPNMKQRNKKVLPQNKASKLKREAFVSSLSQPSLNATEYSHPGCPPYSLHLMTERSVNQIGLLNPIAQAFMIIIRTGNESKVEAREFRIRTSRQTSNAKKRVGISELAYAALRNPCFADAKNSDRARAKANFPSTYP